MKQDYTLKSLSGCPKDGVHFSHILTDYFIFTGMSNKEYEKTFGLFLFCSGAALIYKGVV
jgi:hypothetical protein